MTEWREQMNCGVSYHDCETIASAVLKLYDTVLNQISKALLMNAVHFPSCLWLFETITTVKFIKLILQYVHFLILAVGREFIFIICIRHLFNTETTQYCFCFVCYILPVRYIISTLCMSSTSFSQYFSSHFWLRLLNNNFIKSKKNHSTLGQFVFHLWSYLLGGNDSRKGFENWYFCKAT
jgi:hypothetical protein